MATADPKQEGPRSFARFLEGVGEGDCVREASELLFELNNKLQDEALARSDKVVGEFVLKIKMSCDHKGNVVMVHDIDIKKPKPKRLGSIGWMTKGGNVTFVHPKQTTLPLREVDAPRQQQIDADTGEIQPAREV
jgi:hypothetical protein